MKSSSFISPLWVACLGLSLGLGCATSGPTDGEDPTPNGEAGSAGEGGKGGEGGEGGKGGSGASGQGGGPGGSGGTAGSGGAGKGGSGGAVVGCGDGAKGENEQCDGADLGGQSCESTLGEGYKGTLGCKSNCQFDFTGCAKNPVCGDGAINVAGEECDDSDFAGKTCKNILNNQAASGTLSCTSACKIDASGCQLGPFCGDGKKDDAEACDGDDLGNKPDCATVTGDPNKGGILKCKADCTFDTAGCVDNPTCGDGKVNQPSEQCDQADLVGAGCKSALGNQSATGNLKCKSDCTFDTSGCTVPPFCGDGIRNNAEACDGNDLGGATCETQLGKGFEGPLVCSSNCTISTAQCVKVPFCGDKTRNASEACDGSDLAGATCASVVGAGSTGSLGCKDDCTFDTAACSIPSSCGNGTIDAAKGEQCDGSAFGGKTCASVLGNTKAVGSLNCTNACLIDSSGCSIPPYCGDGKLNMPGEECDDGNNTSGDGCDANCKVVCFPGEKKFQTNCYLDSWSLPIGEEDSLSWDEAQSFCLAGGGHLVTISSKAENDFLYKTLMPFLGPTSPRWIGINDKTTEGVFVWASGEPVTFTFWNSGEGGVNASEDCGEQRWLDGRWNDKNCSLAQLFICEFPPPVLIPLTRRSLPAAGQNLACPALSPWPPGAQGFRTRISNEGLRSVLSSCQSEMSCPTSARILIS
jgi:cysteine-rich repeat protein